MDRENTPPLLRNTGKSVRLPQEIIEEILSILPAKSLLRLRCVSKSWRCLIGSERFIRIQLKKSNKDPDSAHWRVIFNCDSTNPVPGLKQCSVRSYLDDTDIDPSPIDDPKNNHLMIGTNVVGECDGLFCILKQPGCLFLWNPTTRISIELPNLDHEIPKYGFGRDEQSGAYKVFAVVHNKNENKWIGNVYSCNTNSWKTVEHGSLALNDQAGEFVSGKMYWLTESKDYIECFDLESEVFGMIELPLKFEGEHELELRERSGRLSLVCNSKGSRDVWVRVTKGGAMARWGKVKKRTTPENIIRHKKIIGCYETYVYVESLVSPVPHKNN